MSSMSGEVVQQIQRRLQQDAAFRAAREAAPLAALRDYVLADEERPRRWRRTRAARTNIRPERPAGGSGRGVGDASGGFAYANSRLMSIGKSGKSGQTREPLAYTTGGSG